MLSAFARGAWLALVAGAVFAHASDAQTRVLPLGDSITHGGQGHASWRYTLWRSLVAGGHDVDFVGTQQAIFGGDPPVLAWYPEYLTTFDRDHEGRWGWRTDQIAAITAGVAAATQPDIVLIHLGTNDVGQQGAAGVANAETNLRAIIGQIRAVRPSVAFLLAQVIPIGPGNGYSPNANQVPALNGVIAAIAADSTRPSSPIVLVDQFAGFDVTEWLQPDGLHPDTTGENRMAARWLTALAPLLPPPQPPALVVDNPSFELPPLADGALAQGPGTVAGWTFTGSAATYTGIFDPPAGSYAEAAGDGTPIGADGQNVAFLFNNGDIAAMSQFIGAPLEAASEYTLRVAIGRFLPGQPYAFSTYGGYRLELLAGGEVVGLDVDSVDPVVGSFTDATVTVRTDTLPSARVGQPIALRFTLGTTASPRSTHFDRVRLERRSLTASAGGVATPARPLRLSPSPARGPVRAAFTLARPGRVVVEVFDASGRRCAACHQEAWLPAGPHEIPVIVPAATGLHFVRIDTPDAVHVGRAVRLSR